MNLIEKLTDEFRLQRNHVENIVGLIDDGNTIPFIARYRKEMTGSLDDQVLRELSERLAYLRSLHARRQEVSDAIAGQEHLTETISRALESAQTLAEIEDIYRPFRPKRRTRGTIAREKSLDGLAAEILRQRLGQEDLLAFAESYVSAEKEVPDAENAVETALDILAEDFSEDAALRGQLRALTRRSGMLASKAAKKEDSVYRQYYDYAEPVAKIPGHRILAVDRGEREGFLKVSVELEAPLALALLQNKYVKSDSFTSKLVEKTCGDAYARLIFPAIEREIRGELTDAAQEQAIRVFSLNLRQLLMQPPVRGSVTLGLDPAYRTGCKVAVVDSTGKVLDTTVIYPTPPQSRTEEAKRTLKALIRKHGVTTIAIGNGTASRETEIFTAELLQELAPAEKIAYMVVSEAGASVYSASKLGAQEFPEYDVSLRSAVSIARRLQDPLAELVKIDPKAIGVGQYQHDLKPAKLDEALGGVVESCVNAVGVDLNTASFSLLSHIAGISAAVAKNIVAYREENGAFQSRKELLKVKKLGPKAYEQCAGFLRIPDGANFLDHTSVHPESYDAAKRLLEICGLPLNGVRQPEESARFRRRIGELGERKAAEYARVGIPTLRDMVEELLKPGRDPRDELPAPLLRTDVMSLQDLKPGMELTGTVRNVVDFGAFVDIGVHQDGLVHISQICDRFIRHPSEAVKVGDIVKVRVLDVDQAKKRISLSMRAGQ